MTKRPATWSSRLILLLVSSCITFGVLEVAAGYWITSIAGDDAFRTYASLDQLRARAEAEDRPFARFVPHRLLGYVPATNYRDGKDRHNAHGFRGEDFPMVKPKGEFRIVCLGGSTTYTNFVEDHRLSYPSLLQDRLHDAGFEHVRVINAGVPGYATFESLANLQFRALALDPDMIIIYHAVNDVVHRIVWPPRAYRSDDSGFAGHAAAFAADVPLLERSNLLRGLLIRFGWVKSHLGLMRMFGTTPDTSYWWAYAGQVAAGTYPTGSFRRVPAERMLRTNAPVYFRRNIESMIDIARGRGIEPVLATFARLEAGPDDPLSTELIFSEIDAHNAVVRKIGATRDVPVFDFAKVFPRDPKNYVGSVHVGPRGSKVKARLFSDFLVSEGLIPQSVP